MCTALRLAFVSITIHSLWMICQDLFLRYTIFCLVNMCSFSVHGVFLLKIQFWTFLKYSHFFSGWHAQYFNLKMLSLWFSSVLSCKCTRMAINYGNIFSNKGCINSEKRNRWYSLWWWYIRSFWLKGGVGKISGSSGSEGVMWHAVATVPGIVGGFIFTCVLLQAASVIWCFFDRAL